MVRFWKQYSEHVVSASASLIPTYTPTLTMPETWTPVLIDGVLQLLSAR